MARKPRYVWSADQQELVFDLYISNRKSGMYKVAARIASMNTAIPENMRYAVHSMKTFTVTDEIRFLFERAEEAFGNGNIPNIPKPAVEAVAYVPAPVAPAKVDDEYEEPSAEVHLLLAMRKMRADLEASMNLKLNKLLDLLTAPDATRQDVEEELFELVKPKDRLPKLLIIGLLGAQVHIVDAAVGHKYKVRHLEAKDVGSGSMKDLIRNSDLIVTMANFIGHDTENMIVKYVRPEASWFSHHGGIKVLVEKIERHAL